MAKRVLTTEMQQFILDNYQRMGATEIGERFNVAKGTVTSFMRKRNLTSPKQVTIAARIKKLTGRTIITPEEDQYIKENYLIYPVKTLADKMERHDTIIRRRIEQLGLVIPKELIEQRKKDSQIKKGTIPPNKGKKMSAELYEKAKGTFFKKGHLPRNTKYDGYISIRLDNHGRPYAHIRLSRGRFELLHRKIWMDANGPIPAGKILAFKNGDSTDIRLDNLQLITRKENMLRNSIQRYPEDLKSAIRTLGKLKKSIRNYEKQQSDRIKESHV